MKEKKYEIRSFDTDLEYKNENRTLRGYAVVFNSESRIKDNVYEIIKPTALDGVIQNSDVFALYEHDKSRGILARSKYGDGTLTLQVDEKGLFFEFEAPKTSLGDEVLEMVKRGDIGKCSFCFWLDNGGCTFSKREDGTILRVINQIAELADISLVSIPAYDDTCVEIKRSIEAIEEEETKRAKEKLQTYYNNLRNKYLTT